MFRIIFKAAWESFRGVRDFKSFMCVFALSYHITCDGEKFENRLGEGHVFLITYFNFMEQGVILSRVGKIIGNNVFQVMFINLRGFYAQIQKLKRSRMARKGGILS